MFLSSYENKLDKKGRVSVPSSFRAYLNSMGFNGFITYPSFNNSALDACAQDRIERLSESIDSLGPFEDKRDYFATSVLSESVNLNFDSEGRVSIPEKLLKHARIKSNIVFVPKDSFQRFNNQRTHKRQRETGSKTGTRETVETAIESRFEKRGVRCRRFVRGVGILRCFKHNVILLALAFITFAIGDLLNRVCLPLHQPQQIGQGYQSLWICLFQQPSPGIFLDLV